MTVEVPYQQYVLTMHVNRLVGGIPKHPEIVKRWQEARFPRNRNALREGDPQTPAEASARTIEDLGTQAISDEEIAGIWTGFVEEEGVLCLESRNIKAMLKESANILRPMILFYGGKVSSAASVKPIPLKARLAERVFVREDRIPLDRKEPDEVIERPVHVMTPQGPRTALKRTDIVRNVTIRCNLTVFDDGIISEEVLRAILDHASMNGIGTDRSQGAGVFTYTPERAP